ncbi:MAG: hypothetical protein GY696_31415 [Gammaproteobacteria bacterium]|nr:hypothetical protein [Gammaproteobacteria bacterium]
MSADQLEDRGARWGCISLEQIAVSRKARGLPVATLYSSPSPETIQQRDLFISYEQGADQTLKHYLKVKWGLFEQGWPDLSGGASPLASKTPSSGFTTSPLGTV